MEHFAVNACFGIWDADVRENVAKPARTKIHQEDVREDKKRKRDLSIIIAKFVEIATREIGVLEEGTNNCGPKIREYQAATWLKPGPWPWCAAFTAWTLKQWAELPEVRETLKLKTDSDAYRWRCRDASAFGWERWANQRNLKVLLETEQAKAGDIVIFDFSHIGIVSKDQEGDFIETIEGNTNGKGERDSKSGDGVWRKKRHNTLTKCYIRITD